MDPNAALLRIREITNEILHLPEHERQTRAKLADELADRFHSLDEWLSRGGFPPRAWEPWDRT